MRRIIIAALIMALGGTAYAAPDKVKAPQFLLSAGVVGFSAADTAITIYGTKHLGLVESNRLFAPMFEKGRYAAVWAIQGAACAGIILACHHLIHNTGKAGRIAGYALLVAVNLGRAYCVAANLTLHHRVNQGR